MYSIKTKEKEKKTAKSILKVVKEKKITHSNYKECLFENIQMKHKQTRIIQDSHKMFTADQNKVSLSPFNDKKWIKRDGDVFKTYSFGHFRIQEEEEAELIDVLEELAGASERE